MSRFIRETFVVPTFIVTWAPAGNCVNKRDSFGSINAIVALTDKCSSYLSKISSLSPNFMP